MGPSRSTNRENAGEPQRNGSILIRRLHLVPILTAAPADALVDLRIRDGVVEEVGADLRAEDAGQVVDADGRWAIPGLWDAHIHMTQWARTLSRLDLSSTRNPEDVLRAVSADVARTDTRHGSSALIGWGHRSATWTRTATVAELDAVSGDRAVVLISGDGHNGWLNSRALEMLGVPLRTGPLDENEWFAVFARLEELPGAQGEPGTAYRQAIADAAAKGVVGVVDFEFGPGHREWPQRVQDGMGQLRVRTAVYPEGLDAVLEAGYRSGDALPGGAGLISMGPLKIISDGSLNTRTAYCCEPYADAASLDFPRGKQNYSSSQLTSLLHRAHTHGLEVAVHAIGDAAVASALDAFESTGARGSIEHAQLLGRHDAVRMSGLGLRASVQPAHLLDDRDVTEKCWPDRTDRSFALRSLHDAGVGLTMGSDAPVAPLDPWLAMASAVHRSGDERPAWHPEQSLTAAQALAASTDGADTLAAGSKGDLVLLDADPLRQIGESSATATHLRSLHVAATFVAGLETYSDL